jgi:phage shock protein A
MIDRSVGRGLSQLPEAARTEGTTLPDRLEGVLRRIEDRPGDAPVAVSAGFLRWVAQNAREIATDAAELRDQLDVLSREYDETREAAERLKAHYDRATEQLHLADVRVSTLTERVTKLRAEIAAITGKPVTSTSRKKR